MEKWLDDIKVWVHIKVADFFHLSPAAISGIKAYMITNIVAFVLD